jgi:hypothetical protein
LNPPSEPLLLALAGAPEALVAPPCPVEPEVKRLEGTALQPPALTNTPTVAIPKKTTKDRVMMPEPW